MVPFLTSHVLSFLGRELGLGLFMSGAGSRGYKDDKERGPDSMPRRLKGAPAWEFIFLLKSIDFNSFRLLEFNSAEVRLDLDGWSIGPGIESATSFSWQISCPLGCSITGVPASFSCPPWEFCEIFGPFGLLRCQSGTCRQN